jgi:putative membrane protein
MKLNAIAFLFAAAAPHPIVHVNAALNATATVLLVIGLVMIKRRCVTAHKRVMLSAFAVSIAFLACYLWYHFHVGHVEFTHPGVVRYVYLSILASHVLLAITVPFFASRQIYLGYRALGCCDSGEDEVPREATMADYAARHRRLARWTYPIWLYVSVTGVVVYVMLYHLWPPASF